MIDKKDFVKRINDITKDLSVKDAEMIIKELLEFIPQGFYQKCICKIENKFGHVSIDLSNLEKNIKKIKEYYRKIENSEICFRCYSYNTGTYDFFGG